PGDGRVVVDEGDDAVLLHEPLGQRLVAGGVAAVVGDGVGDLVAVDATPGVDRGHPGLHGLRAGADEGADDAGLLADRGDPDGRFVAGASGRGRRRPGGGAGARRAR